MRLWVLRKMFRDSYRKSQGNTNFLQKCIEKPLRRTGSTIRIYWRKNVFFIHLIWIAINHTGIVRFDFLISLSVKRGKMIMNDRKTFRKLAYVSSDEDMAHVWNYRYHQSKVKTLKLFLNMRDTPTASNVDLDSKDTTGIRRSEIFISYP